MSNFEARTFAIQYSIEFKQFKNRYKENGISPISEHFIGNIVKRYHERELRSIQSQKIPSPSKSCEIWSIEEKKLQLKQVASVCMMNPLEITVWAIYLDKYG